jgi:hypothetical protein
VYSVAKKSRGTSCKRLNILSCVWKILERELKQIIWLFKMPLYVIAYYGNAKILINVKFIYIQGSCSENCFDHNLSSEWPSNALNGKGGLINSLLYLRQKSVLTV